ncbi:hypothetical protein Glove_59g104 [Diversispora epigaea]|uniref:Uncharacterized protein n=1 Tax=Diversispora epigaea TaxID=1348612 RepID=A0A397JE44_9GLOM|nr:hypothetical protein Glove_59g104 [Diversispora epigaea]
MQLWYQLTCPLNVLRYAPDKNNEIPSKFTNARCFKITHFIKGIVSFGYGPIKDFFKAGPDDTSSAIVKIPHFVKKSTQHTTYGRRKN